MPPSAPRAQSAPVPLLLDTDIGDDVDDVFALLLMALHPDVALLGVTTVFGDTPQRARIARKLLDLAGRPEVPVAIGQRQTLGGRDPGSVMASGRGFVAAEGSEEWETLGGSLVDTPAADYLVERILSAPEAPVLAAIGPLTNLGAALRRAPEIARKVRSVVLMGGRLGDDARRGEHNFSSDPEATRLVLESGAPLQIGTYEVTVRARLGRQHVARLQDGSAACRAAADQLALYLDLRQRDDTAMYDPLSLTLAYTDRYLTTRPVALRWQPDPTATDERAFTYIEGGAPPTAEVSIGLDAPAFTEHLLATIGA